MQPATAGTLQVAIAAACFGATAVTLYLCFQHKHSWRRLWAELTGSRQQGTHVVGGVVGAVGNTPLICIESLSKATGCKILGKAEFLNPGGSVKDRVALRIVQEALSSGALQPGGLITEGTAGSTGVSLAMVGASRGCCPAYSLNLTPEAPAATAAAASELAGAAGTAAALGVGQRRPQLQPYKTGGVPFLLLVAAAYGCRCFIAMPDDAAIEKAQLLQALGAEVQRLRPVSITHPEHPVNVARRRAEEVPGAVFADQFENLANLRAHLDTGREILQQTGGQLDAFVSGAGTGGTIAGVSQALKAHNPHIQVVLADPQGSSLFNKVKRGVLYTWHEAEGKRLKNPFDTITEGVGLNRLTTNFAAAAVDDAVRVTDREAVEMAAYLLRNDGLFVGSSAAVNCVGAVKVARALGPGHTIVTVLCDGGARHLSKFHSPAYLQEVELLPTASGSDLSWVSSS